jgi:hypothetical protein
MDFLPDGTFYLEDPAALKIPETSEGSGATATLQGPGSGRRLPTLDTSSGFIDDGTLRVADPDALAVPDPNAWRAADPIAPVKPISGSGSNWEWDWETGLVRETWMSTIQQDQHAWEKIGKSWDWLAGCCEECGPEPGCSSTNSPHVQNRGLNCQVGMHNALYSPSNPGSRTTLFDITDWFPADTPGVRIPGFGPAFMGNPWHPPLLLHPLYPCLGFDPCKALDCLPDTVLAPGFGGNVSKDDYLELCRKKAKEAEKECLWRSLENPHEGWDWETQGTPQFGATWELFNGQGLQEQGLHWPGINSLMKICGKGPAEGPTEEEIEILLMLHAVAIYVTGNRPKTLGDFFHKWPHPDPWLAKFRKCMSDCQYSGEAIQEGLEAAGLGISAGPVSSGVIDLIDRALKFLGKKAIAIGSAPFTGGASVGLAAAAYGSAVKRHCWRKGKIDGVTCRDLVPKNAYQAFENRYDP